MPQSRIAVFVLLIVAILGAALLWWSSGDGSPPASPLGDEQANATAAEGSVKSKANTDGAAAESADEVDRTEVRADEATATSAKGALRVTVLWPDAVPATDVMVYVRRSQRRLPYTALARGTTDDSGVVVFTGVPLGAGSLISDRGDRKKITVAAGEQDVTFELKGGVAVRGTVSDSDGVRVAGAEVWLQTTSTSWSAGRIVGVTDAQGAFALQHIDAALSLGAVADGFAPSKLVDLDIVDTSKPPAIVNLELQHSGGRLEGTVTDHAGAPIATALVAVGKRPRHLDYRGGRVIEQWTPRTAETDESGHFAIRGLAAGTLPVAIRADGYGFWRGETEITALQTTVIEPQLLASAVITGTVTDGDGAPVANAAIRAYDRAPRTSFVAGGQVDFYETFGYRGTLSDAAGHYRLEGVTPGVVHLFAQRSQKRHKGVSVAYTTAQLEVQPGSETEWNPVISDGLAIEGIVLYRDGFPMKSVFITLADERSGKKHVMVNDRHGVFRFLCLENSTYGVRVQYWDAPKGTPPLQASGIIPNRGRVELRAPFNKPVKHKNGIVIGRIDDMAGRIRNPKAARVILHSDKRWFREDGKIVDGAFRFERVTPCRFRLTLMEGSTTLAQSDWFELLPAATVDTGVLTTEPGGRAKITIVRPKGTESFEPQLYLKREGDARGTVIELGRNAEAIADNLTPGEFKITGYFKGMVTLRAKMTVTAGQTSELTLTMQEGARCRFSVWWPEGKVSASRHYRILDSSGKVFHEYEGDLGTSPTRPYAFSTTIPPGRWKVEFSTDDGLKGEDEFVVANTTDEVKVRIDLK